MRRILASTLALFAVAFAGPPIDYELTCGEGGTLVGVLSLTQGKVHVAFVAGSVCDVDVVVTGPDAMPAIEVVVRWGTDPLGVTVTIDGADAAIDDVDVVTVMVPAVAVDGMLDAQRLRAAALERRAEAQAQRDATREGRGRGDDDGEDGDVRWGPPSGLPSIERPVGPPTELPPIEPPAR